MTTVKIGSRGSDLALWQANFVKDTIEKCNTGVMCDITIIKTTGDKLRDVKLDASVDKGFFTKEIEEALMDKRIDIAVHSLKDLPTELPPTLTLGAVSKREIANDVLISKDKKKLAELPRGAKIGTSSPRRKSQLMHYRHDFRLMDIRGNLPTRIRKVDSSDLDAVVVAYAGVKRLGFESHISEIIPFDIMLPAISQGALGIEIRKNDLATQTIINCLNDVSSYHVAIAERSLLRKMQGGCQVPVGAYGTITNDKLTLEGMISSLDGKQLIRKKMTGNAKDSESIGIQLADDILRSGGERILREFRNDATC